MGDFTGLSNLSWTISDSNRFYSVQGSRVTNYTIQPIVTFCVNIPRGLTVPTYDLEGDLSMHVVIFSMTEASACPIFVPAADGLIQDNQALFSVLCEPYYTPNEIFYNSSRETRNHFYRRGAALALGAASLYSVLVVRLYRFSPRLRPALTGG